MYSMAGKVAIVTGGGAGIGRGNALLFAREGVKVVVSEINETSGKKTVDMIHAEGGEAVYFKCDASKEEDVKAMVDFAIDTYGALHFATNIIGTSTNFTPITEVPLSDFQKMLAINVQSVFLGLKYEIPAIIKSGGGAIVNCGSAGSVKGIPNQGAYSAAKHAVAGMTKSAAIDYARQNIRINCVMPGSMLSEGMQAAIDQDPHFADVFIEDMPCGYLLKPEEVSKFFVYLCSDQASVINGAVLAADGGLTAK